MAPARGSAVSFRLHQFRSPALVMIHGHGIARESGEAALVLFLLPPT